MKKKVVVVVPTHKKKFTKSERISLYHLTHYLSSFEIVYALPKGHLVKDIEPKFEGVEFSNKYFTSIASYCELLNKEEFYTPFLDYEYMLIYHTDALVFSSDLLRWCNSGFDYIAAPWPHPIIGYLTHPIGGAWTDGGNGGLSLRNIKKSIEVIRKVKKEAKRSAVSPFTRKLWFIKAVLTGQSHNKWLQAPAGDYPFNEDGFWSFEAPKYVKNFRVAPLDVSRQFAIEQNPRQFFEKNNKKLPFGCHAWEKYDKTFWRKYLISSS